MEIKEINFKCNKCVCSKCKKFGECDDCNYCIKPCEWCDELEIK